MGGVLRPARRRVTRAADRLVDRGLRVRAPLLPAASGRPSHRPEGANDLRRSRARRGTQVADGRVRAPSARRSAVLSPTSVCAATGTGVAHLASPGVATIAASPTPGKMNTLLACPISRARPSSDITGSNGLPVATSARPRPSGQHLARGLPPCARSGFESGKTIGCEHPSPIARRTGSVNVLGVAVVYRSGSWAAPRERPRAGRRRWPSPRRQPLRGAERELSCLSASSPGRSRPRRPFESMRAREASDLVTLVRPRRQGAAARAARCRWPRPAPEKDEALTAQRLAEVAEPCQDPATMTDAVPGCRR